MTREELLGKAVFIKFPLTYKTYYPDYDQTAYGPLIYRLPLPQAGEMYDDWHLNENHFTPKYHLNYVLPLLREVLDLPMSSQDFDFVPRTDSTGQHDISYLRPRKECRYEVFGFNRNEHFEDISFSQLQECSSHDAATEYHQRYYKYAHECSRVINKTLDNNLKLFISGDSQMIPHITTLTTYFKEVWYMDNRSAMYFQNKYLEIDFSHVLVELNCNSLAKYVHWNFQ